MNKITNQEKEAMAGVFNIMSSASIVYGIILIIISMLIFTNVGKAYILMATLLGIYLVVKGFIDFFATFNSHNSHRGMTLFASIVNFIVGLFVLGAPVFATTLGVAFIFYIIGLTFILGGVISFEESIPMAIISIIIGLMMFIFTKESAIVVAWFIALLLLLSGIITILFGATTRNIAREIKE